MALPSKKSKFNINLDPPKVGNKFLKYGFDRIEQLMINTDKNRNYLPRSIHFEHIDNAINDYVNDGELKLIIDGKDVPVFYLENERWGEFSETWKFMDADKNVPTPYIIVRRTGKEVGTRLGIKWIIPQGKAFRYLDVPILDEGQIINLRFKIPEPTNIDFLYEISLFTKYLDIASFSDIFEFFAKNSNSLHAFSKKLFTLLKILIFKLLTSSLLFRMFLFILIKSVSSNEINKNLGTSGSMYLTLISLVSLFFPIW